VDGAADGQRRNWACILSTVLFGVATLQLFYPQQQGSPAGFGGTVLYYGIAVLFVAAWLAGAAAVWLLWRPASSAFFSPRPLFELTRVRTVPDQPGAQGSDEERGSAWAMKRWMAALGSLAVVCFLPACGSNSSSVAGSSPTPPASFAVRADQVAADLAAGKFTAVEGRFDPAMMKAARAAPPQKGWAACQDAMGKYRSHGAPTFARKGRFDLEQVPVTWANGPEASSSLSTPMGPLQGCRRARRLAVSVSRSSRPPAGAG